MNGRRADPDAARTAELRTDVAAAFAAELVATGSRLLEADGGLDDLRRQAANVVDDVTRHVGGPVPTGPPSFPGLTADIGVRRASNHVDPEESVRAAALLFQVALPALVDGLAEWEPDPVRVALWLNRCVLERIAVGSVSYARFLLAKVHDSHVGERRRIARELHDRVAHGVGVALQGLELAEVYGETDRRRADAKLASARTELVQALDDARRMSRDIRETVSDAEGLEQALASFLDRRATGIRTELSVTGDCASIPHVISEEVYVVLREAVRNAIRHADATRLRVTVRVDETEVTGAVSDDGHGFDPSAPVHEPDHGLGVVSMRERIALLGGRFAIDSDGGGTVVSVTVPLRRGAW